MMIEQHYDEEVLIALLDEQTPDPHLASCETCKASMNSIRKVTSALHDETVWDRREISEEPRPETRNALRSFASSVAAEDAAAEPWVKSLLARPSSEWRVIVDAHPEWRTAGFVRKLIAAVDSINFTAPTDAVELTRIIVDVAEALHGGGDRIAKLRATAWREYAYALYYVGSYTDSLRALDSCDQNLNICTVSGYDGARAALVRALVLGGLERFSEAFELASDAQDAFAMFGDRRRALVAEGIHANMLVRARRFTEALPFQLRIAANEAADAPTRACATEAAAICYRELSEIEEAKKLFASAAQEYERLGLVAFRTKARWNFATLLTAEGRYDAAVEMLREAKSDIEELGLAHSIALISIDIAEALLLSGQPAEVAELCRSAMSYFERSQLSYTSGALSAFAYLREAAESKALKLADVSDVRGFFEILPKQPELLFARPA